MACYYVVHSVATWSNRGEADIHFVPKVYRALGPITEFATIVALQHDNTTFIDRRTGSCLIIFFRFFFLHILGVIYSNFFCLKLFSKCKNDVVFLHKILLGELSRHPVYL